MLIESITPSAVTGIGLHSGEPCTVSVSALPSQSGIHLAAGDSDAVPLRSISSVEVPLRTRILVGPETVDTVEHMMAALAISGLDDVVIRIDGPEVPAMDGSAAPWLEFFNDLSSKQPTGTPGCVLEVTERATYAFGDSEYTLTPGETLVSVEIDYQGTPIGVQNAVFREREFPIMATARTFCLETDLDHMRRANLALGGSLKNAVVMSAEGPLNSEGLRLHNEFAAHKALDLVGDLFLAGAPLYGQVFASRPGHTSNGKLLETALSDGVFAVRNLVDFEQKLRA